MPENIRYFSSAFVSQSETSQKESEGKPHFREYFDCNGKRIRFEEVTSTGDVSESIEFKHLNDFLVSCAYGKDKKLKSVSYDLTGNKNIFENSRVQFAGGKVIYPIKSVKEENGSVIIQSLSISPGIDYKEIAKFENQEAQLYMPRKRDLFCIDFKLLREYMKELNITAKLAHGPDSDIFDENFLGTVAWIRGNTGIKTITFHPSKGNYGAAVNILDEKSKDLEMIGAEISYENMDANDRWLKSPEELLNLNIPFVSATLDISHLAQSTDLLALEERIFPKLRVVHLSNTDGNRKHLPYREGIFPVQEFLRKLKADKYKGFIVFEYSEEYKEKEKEDIRRVKEIFG
jgi:hypothetical protein